MREDEMEDLKQYPIAFLSRQQAVAPHSWSTLLHLGSAVSNYRLQAWCPL